MISEHISQTFENDHKHSQVKEKPKRTNELAYPRSRNILIYRNQSERGMPSWNRKAKIRGKFILCKSNHFVASKRKWHPETKAAGVRISPYKHETRSDNHCKLYWKRTTWDVLGPTSVQIRKNGNLLALKRERKKPKQGKEIGKRTKKNRSLVLETKHRQESL